MPVTPDEFRRAAAQFVSGVTVVTTLRPGGFHGMTVSAFCSVSLEPAMVMVCLDGLSQGLEYVLESQVFAVNILSRDQTFLADRFAGRAPLVTDFTGVPHHVGETGVPRFDDALAWVECRLDADVPTGDHRALFGRVIATGQGRGTEPLVYFRSGFKRLGQA